MKCSSSFVETLGGFHLKPFFHLFFLYSSEAWNKLLNSTGFHWLFSQNATKEQLPAAVHWMLSCIEMWIFRECSWCHWDCQSYWWLRSLLCLCSLAAGAFLQRGEDHLRCRSVTHELQGGAQQPQTGGKVPLRSFFFCFANVLYHGKNNMTTLCAAHLPCDGLLRHGPGPERRGWRGGSRRHGDAQQSDQR